jgi:hypothetical protein
LTVFRPCFGIRLRKSFSVLSCICTLSLATFLVTPLHASVTGGSAPSQSAGGPADTQIAQNYDRQHSQAAKGNSLAGFAQGRGADADDEVAARNDTIPITEGLVMLLLGIWGMLWWGLPAIAEKKCRKNNCDVFAEKERGDSPQPFVCLKMISCIFSPKAKKGAHPNSSSQLHLP